MKREQKEDGQKGKTISSARIHERERGRGRGGEGERERRCAIDLCGV